MINLSFSIKDLEYFLLIMTRVSCFIFAAPFFGMNNTPARVKIALGAFVSFLLYQAITPAQYAEYSTVFGYAVIIMKEALTGLIIGFGAQICIMITGFAGHIVDMETGLSMVSQFDPTTKQNVTITGVLYNYTVMLALIITGMYGYILRALADSFRLIPVNAAVFHTDRLLHTLTVFLGDYIVIGFRICLPIFAVTLLVNAILGVLAKVSPQLNMFAVGIQIKILIGLTVLFFTFIMLPSISNFIMEEIKTITAMLVESMR